LALALDEPRESDAIYDIDGFQYVIDRHVLSQFQPITVDFGMFGFQISGNNLGASGCC
jgi:Fe-S cluster assembly iron-binding protein IscA